MNPSCQQLYGSDYPAAVDLDGIKVPLARETRFTRHYASKEHQTGTAISRLFDGSASITIPELQREWDHWNQDERSDFCFACIDFWGARELPEMVRFMAQHANPNDWRHLAFLVATILPSDEAFGTLEQVLTAADAYSAANVAQGIALTESPKAEAVLRRHLETVWTHATLWDHAEDVNHIAFDATVCTAYLIALGAAPAEFEGRVRQLAAHACPRNRKQCRRLLAEYYEWLT